MDIVDGMDELDSSSSGNPSVITRSGALRLVGTIVKDQMFTKIVDEGGEPQWQAGDQL